METENQKFQKRLAEVQGKINILTLRKEQNDKDKAAIDAELKKLGIANTEELSKKIEEKQATLVLTKQKFESALKKLEENTNEFELKVKS